MHWHDDEHDEVAKVAMEVWRARGSQAGSPEGDWYRAEQIVRERRLREQNSSSKENQQTMAADSLTGNTMTSNTMTGNTAAGNQPGQQGTGQTISGAVSSARERLGEMTETQPKTMPNPRHREGSLARGLEQQTARIPSDAWLWAAVGSIGLSLAFELSGKERTANFVGHWAPTLLIVGLYNKMVKLQGSDGV